MLRVFQKRAGSFVAVGWLLFVLSIPVCLLIGAMAGFNAFYFSTHRRAPLDAFDINASMFVLAAAAFAAVTSSIALTFKFRVVASALVVAVWMVITFGTPGARLFVKPGPEYFERHAGGQVFSVPWQYRPAGPGRSTDQANQIGFSAMLCLSNLKGNFDEDCLGGQQLYVLSKEDGFTDFELNFWRKRSSQMSPEPARNGYQSFAYSVGLPTGGPTLDERYFVRQDSQGQLTRLVVCRLGNENFCSRHALVGNYWLRYDAPLTDGDTLDGKLAALVDSWRRR